MFLNFFIIIIILMNYNDSLPDSMTLTLCLAHGLNRVGEEIRSKYPKVNKLVSNVKKIYLKTPLRISIFNLANLKMF